MRIAVVCHKPITTATPRGGEKSVRAIVEYLRERGHTVETTNGTPTKKFICGFDLALTWGRPAVETARICKEAGRPLCLMVRFWKNIAPLPAGDLAARPVDHRFTEARRELFEHASAIITNSKYAKAIIHRWQPDAVGKTHVSYVPITGKFLQSGDPDGALTIVTPEVYGEFQLVKQLTDELPEQKINVVNADEIDVLRFGNLSPYVNAYGYCDMSEVFRKTKILLVPVYSNDICGTRRVTIEAFRHGVPVIAMDRSGMCEKVPPTMLIRREAGPAEWVLKIREIECNYELFQRRARAAWERYDTAVELEGFEKILLECVS